MSDVLTDDMARDMKWMEREGLVHSLTIQPGAFGNTYAFALREGGARYCLGEVEAKAFSLGVFVGGRERRAA